MRGKNKALYLSIFLIVTFVVWTILVKYVNVEPIGPNGSSVGFSFINGFVKELIGTNMILYTITDWLGLIPFATVIGFAILGLVQWIKRKSLLKVDSSLFVLGAFYIVVFIAYNFFEIVVINCRPVLINGYLEVSYPSSTTMLTMTVMPTAMIQLIKRISSKKIKWILKYIILLFTVFMVVGRMVSGVHWISDIIGGALLSSGLVALYYYFDSMFMEEKDRF